MRKRIRFSPSEPITDDLPHKEHFAAEPVERPFHRPKRKGRSTFAQTSRDAKWHRGKRSRPKAFGKVARFEVQDSESVVGPCLITASSWRPASALWIALDARQTAQGRCSPEDRPDRDSRCS